MLGLAGNDDAAAVTEMLAGNDHAAAVTEMLLAAVLDQPLRISRCAYNRQR